MHDKAWNKRPRAEKRFALGLYPRVWISPAMLCTVQKCLRTASLWMPGVISGSLRQGAVTLGDPISQKPQIQHCTQYSRSSKIQRSSIVHTYKKASKETPGEQRKVGEAKNEHARIARVRNPTHFGINLPTAPFQNHRNRARPLGFGYYLSIDEILTEKS